MSFRIRVFRFLTGLLLLLALLFVSFSTALPWIHTNGATAEEIAAAYPGDELIANPIIDWTHALTIHAAPLEVWPWIAQLGDVRGGFYSYTFIENLIVSQDMYHNANRIIPEFQNPQPGDVLISDTLHVREVKPGDYLLADLIPNGMFDTAAPGMGWTWLWQIFPYGDGQTRLIVRMQISEPPGMEGNPILTTFLDLGGWVMERNMLVGIKERAEGVIEPTWIEIAEIALWFAALLPGLIAAWLYLTRPSWSVPLLISVASVLALVFLTLIQPAIWLRALLDLALIGAAIWAARHKSSPVHRASRQALRANT